MEFFSNIQTIPYEGPTSKNPLAFKYYNRDEVIGGKTMAEHLKFSMAYWHTLCADGTDLFGIGTIDKSFGGKDAMTVFRAKLKEVHSGASVLYDEAITA